MSLYDASFAPRSCTGKHYLIGKPSKNHCVITHSSTGQVILLSDFYVISDCFSLQSLILLFNSVKLKRKEAMSFKFDYQSKRRQLSDHSLFWVILKA